MEQKETEERKDGGKLLSASQAAFEIGVTEADLARLREQGKLVGVRGKWGRWYYTLDALAAVIAEAPPTQTPSVPVQPPTATQSLTSIFSEIGPLLGKPAEGEDNTSKAPLVRMANAIFVLAVDSGASDIHLEHDGGNLRVRFRIDGILQEIMKVPDHIRGPLIQRYKVMADINILERRVPQAGWIPIIHVGIRYDLRVATLPSRYGENVTMHILKIGDQSKGLASLGMSDADRYSVENIVSSAPSSLMLIAGPSGSGITTTAYNLLFKLNSVELKIVSLEKLREYNLPGMTQSYYGKRSRSSLSDALRLLPLMDADILFLADINTPEAAEGAVEAALSGKRVIATMAANDTSAALWRLGQMGIHREKMERTLLGVVAQRLVRRICADCYESYTLTLRELTDIGLPASWKERKLWRGAGCDICRGSGYKGLSGIFEVSDALHKSATLHEAGERLVLAGITTPDEITRVLGRSQNSSL